MGCMGCVEENRICGKNSFRISGSKREKAVVRARFIDAL
jgi:hypothetical protein